MKTIEIPVRHMARAWRVHAQPDGLSDPAVELLAREAVAGTPRAGYRPAFRVPSKDLVVEIYACQPHRTSADAIDWLGWMLEQLHNNGNIQLHREAS
ncbi:hypothetical protein QWY79_10380 [Halomonas sabkhae]|uniref:hypothetical protein n=1 Tax=Halomonas sabkhae TaxID=626223 RepID=UPI0025B50627|nr:hypothetical protein [Halomonas sabkhae]MDN3525669.1 hypothetical protein [Halomonas sabkhae]